MSKIADLMDRPEKPTIKLYEKDLAGLKNIDVDDKCTLILQVVAKSKYREDYIEGDPLCITFDVKKVSRDD